VSGIDPKKHDDFGKYKFWKQAFWEGKADGLKVD
jgi:hypothetical protein